MVRAFDGESQNSRGQSGIVCFFQLVDSPIWLKSFFFGPLEWVWRCLTYPRWAAPPKYGGG